MSTIEIRSALEVELNSMSPSISTKWENVDYTPVVGLVYQRAKLLLGTPDNMEFGPVFTQPGVFEITLFYPLKSGTTTAVTRAELIRSTFKRGNSYSSGASTVIINKTANIKSGWRVDDRWVVTVDIEFFAHVTA